ncbi:hypothetical protein, partial [Nitrosomonas sp.]|uniref:hypothetical protein n=1 Tax=Nitrosomonas sp. TaxID=42353 RepID=UPI0025FC5E81
IKVDRNTALPTFFHYFCSKPTGCVVYFTPSGQKAWTDCAQADYVVQHKTGFLRSRSQIMLCYCNTLAIAVKILLFCHA